MLLTDTLMSFMIRCIVGGFSTAAVKCTSLFAVSEITFLLMGLNIKRSRNNGTAKNGRV